MRILPNKAKLASKMQIKISNRIGDYELNEGSLCKLLIKYRYMEYDNNKNKKNNFCVHHCV